MTTTWGRSLADATATEPPRAGDAIPNSATARPLAEDTRSGRIGEIMPNPIPAHLLDAAIPRNVRLRPAGGGCEWNVPEEFARTVAP
jgi:hypothetical protein